MAGAGESGFLRRRLGDSPSIDTVGEVEWLADTDKIPVKIRSGSLTFSWILVSNAKASLTGAVSVTTVVDDMVKVIVVYLGL